MCIILCIQRPHKATQEEMTKFHSDDYIKFLRSIRPDNMSEFNKQMQRCVYILFFAVTVGLSYWSVVLNLTRGGSCAGWYNCIIYVVCKVYILITVVTRNCEHCRAAAKPAAGKVQFRPYFYILRGFCNNAALLIRAKFGMRQDTHGLSWHTKFHLNVFIVSASGGQKPQFWANSDIWGDSCSDPLLLMRTKFDVLEQTEGLHVHAKFHMDPSETRFYHLGILWCQHLMAIWESWT